MSTSRSNRQKLDRRVNQTRSFEMLEPRNLLAANLTATLTNGLLQIEGTDVADNIVVRQVGSNLVVDGAVIKGPAGATLNPLASAVHTIRVDALAGNDLVWIHGNRFVNVQLSDQPGTDLIVAGPQATVTKAASDLLIRTSNSPLWKTLETLTPNSSGQYILGNAKVGGFTLNNVVVSRVSASGISLNGNLSLPVFGSVKLAGILFPNGFFYSTMPERSILGGVVGVKNVSLTIAGDRATVKGDLSVQKLGITSQLNGSIQANGTYNLEANATFKVAGFQVNTGKLRLGDKLNVDFTIPIPSFGNVNFKGSYGTAGWAIQGTVPVNIPIGVVVLKQITIGVGKDQGTDVLIIGAKGTIASVNGIVDAVTTAKIYSDGRLNLTVNATAVKVGNFAIGNAVVNIRNDSPAGKNVYIATLEGNVQFPGLSSPVKLIGVITSQGDYSLTGIFDTTVAGLTLSNTRFTLKKSSGLSLQSSIDFGGIKALVTGTATFDGVVKLQGTGAAGQLSNGFTARQVTIGVNLNRPANSYTIQLSGSTNLVVANANFSATATSNGITWTFPTIRASAQVGGALAAYFSGSANFVMESNRVTFTGNLGLKSAGGVSVGVTGTVYSDGSVKFGYKNSAGKWLSQQLDNAGTLVKEWLYYDAAGTKLQQFRGWAAGKLIDLEQFTIDGWKQYNKYLSTSGKWVSQQLDSAGTLVKEWLYYDSAGTKIQQFRAWAGGKLTDLELFTTSGWKEYNKYLSTSGKWVSQQLDSAGTLVKQWLYYDSAGTKIQEFRAWAGGKLTDLELFTTSGWKEYNKYLSDSGKWISQQLNSVGSVVKEWRYYDAAGTKIEQFRAWAGGKLTDFEQFTTAGWKEYNRFLNSSGKWVSHKLNSGGKIINQWIYYGGYGSQLREWAAWTSAGKLTDLQRYTSNNIRTLSAYFDSKGQWIERHYSSITGNEYALKIWSSAGSYLGDQYKNFKDAASGLDPTTSDWWPF